MAENSEISWTDHTFNAWIGCTKVSPGCANCYAESAMSSRFKFVNWGDGGTRKITSPDNWRKVNGWNRRCAVQGIRQKVFCQSLADTFEDWSGTMLAHDGSPAMYCEGCELLYRASPSVANGMICDKCCRVCIPATMSHIRRELFRLATDCPWLDFLFLTKRPENIQRFTPPNGYMRNASFGTSVEDQERAESRIPALVQNAPERSRLFLSCEPLLGLLNLRAVDGMEMVNWVIVGGESGPMARPMNPDWVRSIRDQCEDMGIAFFFKQWGEWRPDPPEIIVGERCSVEGHQMVRVGKLNAGNELDGEIHMEFP